MDKIQNTIYGMVLDQVFFERKPGGLSYAMNANLQSRDGRGITYTNEYSNQLCVQFPTNFTVIGTKLVLSRNEILFALVNTVTGESEIGKVTGYNCNTLTAENVEYDCTNCRGKILKSTVTIADSCCKYERIIRANCLNFNIDYPVRMIYKITNCGYKLYFTDGYNEPRYIDLNDFQNGVYIGKDACNDLLEFDCERIKIFKDFCIPDIKAVSEEGSGSLQAGMYQATLAYCDSYGREMTDYFNHTNPIPVFERKMTIDTDYTTNKSIKFKITHNTDVFEYFKVVIIKTVNETSDYKEAGVFRVTDTNEITFGQNDRALIDSDINKITTPKPDYTTAKLIEESANYLLLCDLEDSPEYNFQPFASRMKLYWETVNMPYDTNNNYSNPLVVSDFRGYMRDEVYPFGIRFKLKNGKHTKAFHIPSRFGLDVRDSNPVFNDDTIMDDGCTTPTSKPRWQVYNTGYNQSVPLANLETYEIGTPVSYPPSSDGKYPDSKICDLTRGSYGEFAYWESTEKYPCDDRIWGELADTPIRYHKFPDSVINHIHDGYGDITNPNTTSHDINHASTVYPIGVRLDENVFNEWIAKTLIYNPKTGISDIPMSDLVCGFEIVRGNRVGNKSVIAKGLMYDVGRVTERKDGSNTKSYFMPNYPYNDIHGDAYLSADSAIYNDTDPTNPQENLYRLHGYATTYAEAGPDDFKRFTFHGPDIHFQRPALGTYLKLETEEIGVSEGHFVPVEDHPKYKFLTKADMYLSSLLGGLSASKFDTGNTTDLSITSGGIASANISFNYSDFINTANGVRDMLESIIPRRNFAYSYNSRGVYNNFKAVPNDDSNGRKIRGLDIAKYLSSNNQNLGDTASVHNYGRESSVYLKTTSKFRPYTQGYDGDQSRVTLTNNYGIAPDWGKQPGKKELTKIQSFYGSIKKFIPDQYGKIENLRYLPTGYSVTLKEGRFVQTYYPIFGGDTFINRFALKRKMPFFTQNMVGRPDEIAFDYDLVPNFAFPTYYVGTSPDEKTLSDLKTKSVTEILIIIAALTAARVSSVIPMGGTVTSAILTAILTVGELAFIDLYASILSAFLPKNNLDDDTSDKTIYFQSGKFYLFNYGIPNFFVESDINVDYRYARNEKEENFYPNVGDGIPDEWLQEKNVPILPFDNKYNYNATYSIQNYQELIESYTGIKFDKLCQSHFPNRIIYSEKSNNEENSDNWLKFGSDNYYDFDKTNGNIVAINGLDNNKLMVRFENNFQLWNTRITLPSSSPLQVSLSNSGMFSQDPLEYSKTYLGHGGSQHIAFEKTRAGNFWVDAKRGVVFRFSSQLDEISQPNYNWFKENLPFKILNDFPTYNVDNSFKDIGLSICWDERFQRLFITKNDYELLPQYKGKVYYEMFQGKMEFVVRDLDIVRGLTQLTDTEYFANKSFTIAWSPIINNWVSFYSFLPNYYISLPGHFQTGIHNSLWNHGLSNLSYQIYYNKHYPYILELPISNVPTAEYLKSVTVHTDIMKYTSETDYYSLKSVNKDNYNIFFTKAIVYNKEQCTGMLNLVETPINNLYEKTRYPIFNRDSISILYAKYDKLCTFNTFFDATRDHSNGQPIFTNEWTSIQSQYPIDKVLNPDNFNYSSRYMKSPVKSNECYVRLIQDEHSRYKFVNNFEIFQQETRNQ